MLNCQITSVVVVVTTFAACISSGADFDRPAPVDASLEGIKATGQSTVEVQSRPLVEPVMTKVPCDIPADVEARLGNSYDEYVHYQYWPGYDLARTSGTDRNRSWKILGGVACSLKDRAGALKVWPCLDTQGKQFVKYICSRNAVDIP